MKKTTTTRSEQHAGGRHPEGVSTTEGSAMNDVAFNSQARSFAALRMTSLLLAAAGMVFLVSCGSPNTASIVVRKQNQDLQVQIATLTRAREADAATIRNLQARVGTIPTLSQERLEKLFTVHGIQLGRLTGGADLDRSKPGDEGIKVYITPTDDDGEPLK